MSRAGLGTRGASIELETQAAQCPTCKRRKADAPVAVAPSFVKADYKLMPYTNDISDLLMTSMIAREPILTKEEFERAERSIHAAMGIPEEFLCPPQYYTPTPMKFNDYVIVTRGPHKSRFAVRVYSLGTGVFVNEVYVEKRSGCGVCVGRRDVRLRKKKKP